MVRGLFAGADIGIYLTVLQQVGTGWRQQDMVDSNAVVAVPGPGLIIPETIESGGGMSAPGGLGEATVQDPAVCRAALGSKQRVLAPDLRTGGVFNLRNDIVISGHQGGHLIHNQILGPGIKPFHPSQFIVVFRSGAGVAIGQVKTT